jgi:hypothetical protein
MIMTGTVSVIRALHANTCPVCGRRHRKGARVLRAHAIVMVRGGYRGYDYDGEAWVMVSYDVPGPLTARLDAQAGPDGEGLAPGTPGYWTVAGARALDIRPGDLVLSGWKDSNDPSVIHHAEYEVAEMAHFKDPMMDTVRVGFITTAGQFASVGMMQPMALARPGTHCTLGDYVR